MTEKTTRQSGPGRPKDLAKRQAILEAAQRLFLAKGYEGCSMDVIATEAGVSKLTVYSHFNDKESLFAEAVMSKCNEQLPELLYSLAPESSLAAALEQLAVSFVLLVNSRESVELHRLMISQGASDPQLSKLFFEAGPQQVLNGMSKLFEQATAQGRINIAEPHNAAEHFCCLLKGGLHFRQLIGLERSPSEDALRSHAHEVTELFLRAYSA